MNDGRRRWFTGLVIGLVFGLAALIGGTIMAALGLVAAGLLSIRPGRRAGLPDPGAFTVRDLRWWPG